MLSNLCCAVDIRDVAVCTVAILLCYGREKKELDVVLRWTSLQIVCARMMIAKTREK